LFARRARVSRLYLGVNVSDFPPVTQRVAAPRLLCTRGFLPVYNNRYLVEGLAARERTAAPVPTTFVSAGPELDRVRALADRILSPEQRSDVAFLGGVCSARLHAELSRSQIYASLSVSDGTSISLLEALASGLFPILSDIPQNREWIDPSAGNGILVPLNDPAALAAAIERAVRDEELRLRAATFNRRVVCERADARTNMALLAARLRELIATSSLALA
jgi:glycosyltransferase involved in cell wall biosynthesis